MNPLVNFFLIIPMFFASFLFGQEETLSFSSMGTIWSVHFKANNKSIDKNHILSKLLQISSNYDETFSDWSKESELRKLEKLDLKTMVKPSPLFFQGLAQAYEAYRLTGGRFDITLGSVLWEVRSQAVGMDKIRIDYTNKKFKFIEHPERLTFGGLVKGMAVGEMASFLYKGGLKNFTINGGNGNLCYIGEYVPKSLMKLPKGSDTLYFVSQSASMQNKFQHILLPNQPSKKINKSVSVVCYCDVKEVSRWQHYGGLSDIYSTALLLSKEIILPEYCHEIVPKNSSKV